MRHPFYYVARGFTLVELMVVVCVAAILAIIAVPSYTSQIRKARRSEAKTALLDLAGREERFMGVNGTYTVDPNSLGYSSFANPIGSGYYTVAFPSAPTNSTLSTATTAGAPAYFKVTATAFGGQQQDTPCYTLSVDSTGVQSSTDNSSNPTVGCW